MTDAMTDAVLVVAVSYRSAAAATRLLGSLQRGADPAWRLVVVDNSELAGEAASLETACRDEERARVVVAPRNLGYFGGARLGLDTEHAPHPRWVVVANVDLEVPPEFVRKVRSLSWDGVVAPAVRSAVSGRDQNPYLRTRPSAWRVRLWQAQFASLSVAAVAIALAHGLKGLRRTAAGSDRGAERVEPQRIYAPHGSCILFGREYFARGGTLDHGCFLFGEEVTVAERCLELGLEVVHDPGVVVLHDEHGSTGWWRSRHVLRWQRESVQVIARQVLHPGDAHHVRPPRLPRPRGDA